MNQERRHFLRVHSRLMTFIKFLETGKVRRALTRDIGGGGLCLVTEELLQVGTRVEVELRLPDWEQAIICKAEVIWSRPVGEPDKSHVNPTAETGVRFLDIDPKSQELLNQYSKLNAAPPQHQ